MDLKLNLLVLRCRDIEASKLFYENLGIEFDREQHGSGPEHYAVIFNNTVFELYPLKEGEAADQTRLGFIVNLGTDLQESLEAAQIDICSQYEVECEPVFVVEDPDGRKVELTQSDPTGKGWFEGDWSRFRSVLLILAAIAGGLSFLNQEVDPFGEGSLPEVYFYGFGILLGFLCWPFGIVFVVGVQAINPFSDQVWARPTHCSNPFWLKNPLLVTHFAMYFLMAQGVGMLVTSILGGWLQLFGGIGMIVLGLEGLWALQLIMKWFPEKMASDGPEEKQLASG